MAQLVACNIFLWTELLWWLLIAHRLELRQTLDHDREDPLWFLISHHSPPCVLYSGPLCSFSDMPSPWPQTGMLYTHIIEELSPGPENVYISLFLYHER